MTQFGKRADRAPQSPSVAGGAEERPVRQSLHAGMFRRRPSPRSAADDAVRPFISVVSPVYMAEKILPELCERLRAVLSELCDDYEIVLVCDGSPDDSWKVMEALVEEYPELVAVRLSRNFGQHYALTAGMDIANGVWTVVMDCDLQDRPEEIPRLLAKAREGYDIVVARRMHRKHSWWKRATSGLFFRVFSWLSGFRLDGSVGSFRIMSRSVMDGFCNMRESYRMFAGLIEWLGFETTHIDVEHAERHSGESTYNMRRLVAMALDGMISFSNRPLHLSILAGMLLSLAAGLYGAVLIFQALVLNTATAAGWLSTMVATAFLGGLILLNQGILGIYLGRLYNQAKGRPLYVVDRVLIHASRQSATETGSD